MTLSALTDRDAVLRALAEYDELGRESFLTKYGYGPAKAYFLVHNGKRYDSKAIAGVAVGIEYPANGPLKAADFSGGEATVRAKLEQLGFEVESGSPSAKRNPNWTREETILALELYARRRPQLPGETDPDILALSDLLRTYASQRGVVGTPTFRNPNGVSMKVANLSRLEKGDSRKGLAHGAGTEERVWAEFMPDVARLQAAAEAIRDGINGLGQTPIGTENPSGADASPRPLDAVSRGPRPSFGEVVHTRTDGENCLYVMRLHGRINDLFPGRNLHKMAVLKIGRSNDVKRRVVEMNCGFPPGLELAWRPALTQTFASADSAHDAEQALLAQLLGQGFTIGGEFAILPEKQVETMLAAAVRSQS